MRSMKIPIQFFQWIKLARNLEKTYLNQQKKGNFDKETNQTNLNMYGHKRYFIKDNDSIH